MAAEPMISAAVRVSVTPVQTSEQPEICNYAVTSQITLRPN